MEYSILGEDMDYGDQYDDLKWDFQESNLIKVQALDNYPYFVKKQENVSLLMNVRKRVEKMVEYIRNNIHIFPLESRNGLNLFISIHGENKQHQPACDLFNDKWLQKHGMCARALYSEIPQGIKFIGLNKPKNRSIDYSQPSIGKDGHQRANWRHVFLTIPYTNKSLDNPDFRELIIHELAHTAANHVNWRNDDHGDDFQLYENILTQAWDSTN